VRTGYSAIADEWMPIKPGTDGALLLALVHELIALGLYDRDFLARYTNAGQLVNQDAASDDFGLMLRNAEGDVVNPLRPHNFYWWDRHSGQPGGRPHRRRRPGAAGPLCHAGWPDKAHRPCRPSSCWKNVSSPTPPSGPAASPASRRATIRRLAHEMGITARDQKIELPIAWTDSWGKKHDSVTGNPVAFHAMRGLAAHSNGFHTIRTLAILMSLLGTIDRPGGFRHKAPYPRAVPPNARPPKGPEAVKPDTPLNGAPLGWPEGPDDLFVDAAGEPVRIDKGFSWEHPLSAHG
jgi:anaerobic selenocysteine-containing dehydrogenase